MTLIELQKILGDRIETTLNDELTPEQKKKENEKSALVVQLSKQMINNANTLLKANALMSVSDKKEKDSILMITG